MRISDWSSDVCSSDLNAPWNHGRRGSALREPFAAFVCDDETAEGIRPILNEIGWPVEAINKGGLMNAINTLTVSARPSVQVADRADSGDPINDINSLAQTFAPGTTRDPPGSI